MIVVKAYNGTDQKVPDTCPQCGKTLKLSFAGNKECFPQVDCNNCNKTFLVDTVCRCFRW